MPRRLTRKEKQAHTRSCLMASAAKVFARRGLQSASIDEVAEDAGYTKGAFYANFKSKEELFLAMLDERFAGRLEDIDAVVASDADPEDQARRAGTDFTRYLDADPEWQRLFFEFTAHAARN
jgi:AcrR family transcriptional regulator